MIFDVFKNTFSRNPACMSEHLHLHICKGCLIGRSLAYMGLGFLEQLSHTLLYHVGLLGQIGGGVAGKASCLRPAENDSPSTCRAQMTAQSSIT